MASKVEVQSSLIVNNRIIIRGCSRLHFGSEVIRDFVRLDVNVSIRDCERASNRSGHPTMTK
jgi:hypothetical protein